MKKKIRVEGLNEVRAAFKRGNTSIGPIFQKTMSNAVQATTQTIQDSAPYRTGTLRRSVIGRIDRGGFRGLVQQVFNQAPYGIVLEFGRKAVNIKPRRKKALFWKGAKNPVRVVPQPARPAAPWFAPGIEKAQPAVKEIFSNGIRSIVEMIGGS